MQAIILLGGKGTRLQGHYPNLPKALVPIAGRPFLEWQLEWLWHHGIRDVHLAAGHLSQVIRDWVPSNPLNNKLTISSEPCPLGTGGGLKFAETFVRSDHFLVLNGDTIMPKLDFQALIDSGQKSDTIVTLAVTRIQESGRYGTVEFDALNRATAFREKAIRNSGWVNGGVYVARRTIFAQIKSFAITEFDPLNPSQPISLETDVFPALCSENQLAVFPAVPPLLDMGTLNGINAMEQYFRNQLKWIMGAT